MSFNTFGRFFRITTYGESHGLGIGVIIDGCPAGLMIDEEAILHEMGRRRPGQSKLSTERNEPDRLQITSGILDGKTTGAPINIFIKNKNARSKDYDKLKNVYRPSHADYTYSMKYGIRDHRGGGRSSARETACRVAAGSVAKQFLALNGIAIQAYTSKIGNISMNRLSDYSPEEIEKSNVRCPDVEVSSQMEAYILKCKEEGDTCGGVIHCRINGIAAGLGSPLYDKIEARLAFAMLGINACSGFEYGSGFDGASKKGSENNDVFYTDENNNIRTVSNNSGGIQGGLTNGMPILFNTSFKPVSSIKKKQRTIDSAHKSAEVQISGRHDPCVVPRAVPIVEAMAALVLADFLLARRLDTL